MLRDHIDTEHRAQCARDSKRWAAWVNSRLRDIIRRGELAPLDGEDFAARLRSGVVLWRLLETCADDLPATPRGLRGNGDVGRIESLDNLAFVFKTLDAMGVDRTGVGPLDVADARPDLVLGLVWSLMAHVANRERPGVLRWAGLSHARADVAVPATVRKIDAQAAEALGPATHNARQDLADALAYAERRFGVTPLFDADEPQVDERCVVAYLAELRRRVADPSPPPSPCTRREPPWRSTLSAWRDRAAANTCEGRAWAAALREALDALPDAHGRAWDALRKDADALARRDVVADDTAAAALAAGRALGAAAGRAEAAAARSMAKAVAGKEAAAARAAVRAREAAGAALRADAAAAVAVAKAAATLAAVDGRCREAFEEGCRTALKDAAAVHATQVVEADAALAATTVETALAVEAARRRTNEEHALAKRAAVEGQGQRLGELHGRAIRALQDHAEAAIARAMTPSPLKAEAVVEARIAELDAAFDPERAFRALSATLEFVRGHAVSLHHRDAGKLIRAVDAAYDPGERLALFKRAHLMIKQVVVRVTRTEFPREARWTPRPSYKELGRLVEPHERALLLQHLRNFVVAFDNMPASERRALSTCREVVVNLDWLCALAKLCVASDKRRRSTGSPRVSTNGPPPPRPPPAPLALSADER